MSTSKRFCFIPAKAASTRLRKKNILPIQGKALIYYPITNALQSGLFDAKDVILSTESEEIKQLAEGYGATVPYLRDEKLARDPYGVVDVILDFLERFPNYQNYTEICILLPTAPLMLPEDITGSYAVLSEGNFNAVTSVTETEHNALRSIYVQDGHIEPIFPQHIRKASQLLDLTYRLNGAVTWVNLATFWRERTYFLSPWGAYIMPYNRSVDIDNEEGYRWAKFLAERGSDQ